MINKKIISFSSLILFLLAMHSAWAVEIKATVDRNSVGIDDSFQLIFSSTESPDDKPDFSPLIENFEILNQSQSSSSTWGSHAKSNKSIQWILDLKAKQVGQLVIPSIFFGDDKSNLLSMVVTKSKLPNSNKDEELFFEVEAIPSTAYVQSQILYTLRLYRKVQITQARLSEPELADAIIEKLGEDKNYTTEINGVAYAVTERKYAIFPQKSGVSHIEPLTLAAEVVMSSRSRFNGFFNRQSTKTKRISSNAITLTIKPAPENFTGKRWIPAEFMHLEEKWSGDIKEMKVGEPLTRTITLLGKGTTVAQLPTLHDDKAITELKTYPDQPLIRERKDDEGLIALREEKVAFIPSKPGQYILPAIEIPWFNTVTEKMEVARLPELTVIAVGVAPVQTSEPLSLPKTEINKTQPETIVHEVENKFWMWLSVFLACGWLVSLFFLFKKRVPKKEIKVEKQSDVKLKEITQSLKKACKDNNKRAAKESLLAWGKNKFDSHSLSNTASYCDDPLHNEILLLNERLYSNQKGDWNGRKLLKEFTENKAQKKEVVVNYDELEPLFKV